MTIHETIQAHYSESEHEHHRYRSWEHCYSYFRRVRPANLTDERNHAALQLGFYLASWGMYRGSSFLLDYTYTVHGRVVTFVAEPRFDELWNTNWGADEDDHRFLDTISDELIPETRQAYKHFVPENKQGQPTDTLITKVILGTFGCLPACDRFFVDGWTDSGYPYAYLNKPFMRRLLSFCHEHLAVLRQEQASIEASRGIRYPLMKLIDMHFWQIGYQKSQLTHRTISKTA